MLNNSTRLGSLPTGLLAAGALLAINLTGCATADARDTSTTPTAVQLQAVVDQAHAKFKDLKDGKNADYIPILATIPSELFGVAIVTNDGKVYTAGDTDYAFAIESTSKPFNLAMVMQEQGPEAVQEKIGVEPTGLPFNSKIALELLKARSVNPLVNAGAIAQVSMVQAKDEDERWSKVRGNMSAFDGVKELPLSDETFKSEYESSWSNRAIANLLYNYDRLYSDPEEALVVYTKQCSLLVTTKELGVMGATLSNGGVNPVTGKRLLNEEYVPELLSVMLTAGFYDESGEWSYTAGLPAKTGVGGGIVAVVPGEMAIAAFSPRLNEAGNSIRATKAINYISEQLKLSIFDGR